MLRVQINKFEREDKYKTRKGFTFVRYCPNCSTELYGRWYDSGDMSQTIIEEWQQLAGETLCPICGEELPYRNSHYAEDWSDWEFEKFLKDRQKLRIDRAIQPATELETDLEDNFAFDVAYVVQDPSKARTEKDRKRIEWRKDYLSPIFQTQMSRERADQIKHSRELLMEYIEDIFKNEVNISTVNEHLRKLYAQRCENQQFVRQDRYDQTRKQREKSLAAAEKESEKLYQASCCMVHLSDVLRITPTPFSEKLPIEPVFYPGKSQELHDQEMARYRQKKEAYEQARRQADEVYRTEMRNAILDARARLDEAEDQLIEASQLHITAEQELSVARKEAEDLYPAAAGIVEMLDSQIESTKELLKDLYGRRVWLLAQGIIHPNYHSMDAISTLYGYLESERCSTLVGPYGGYNLYENELQNTLIHESLEDMNDSLHYIRGSLVQIGNSLSCIGGNLEQIGHSLKKMGMMQHMLYREVQQANDNLLDLHDVMEDCFSGIRQLNVTAKNSRECLKHISRTSQATQANTEILYWQKALRDMTLDVRQYL